MRDMRCVMRRARFRFLGSSIVERENWLRLTAWWIFIAMLHHVPEKEMSKTQVVSFDRTQRPPNPVKSIHQAVNLSQIVNAPQRHSLRRAFHSVTYDDRREARIV